MRTAYCCEPYTCTCATPLNVDICCASRFSAYSATVEVGNVVDDSTICMIGASAGFTLRCVGGVGIDGGSERAAAAIADCTSCAAASMLRSSENCSVMVAMPSVETDVIVSTPAIVENCFSSGVASADASVSGFSPESCACTWIVGKSTLGSALIGSSPSPRSPQMWTPTLPT